MKRPNHTKPAPPGPSGQRRLSTPLGTTAISPATGRQARAVCRLTAASRVRPAGHLQRGLQPRRRRGVDGGQHRGADQGGHRDGKVMQAVIVDDVERCAARLGQLHHQRQVGVMIGHKRQRRHRRIRLRRIGKRQFPHGQPGAAQVGVRTRRRKQRHPMTKIGQRAGQVPDVGLQPPANGWAMGNRLDAIRASRSGAVTAGRFRTRRGAPERCGCVQRGGYPR